MTLRSYIKLPDKRNVCLTCMIRQTYNIGQLESTFDTLHFIKTNLNHDVTELYNVAW